MGVLVKRQSSSSSSMSKGTTCAQAIKLMEQATGKKASDEEDVRLCPIVYQQPLIEKMDASLSTLKKCRHLRLSSNSIDKISSLSGMDSLEILSLARNQIKKIENLDGVADTLSQLWLSYNNIEKLNGIEKLTTLQVVYLARNKISAWGEIERLQELPHLTTLLLKGNPIEIKTEEDGLNWRVELLKRLPNLKNIDGALVEDEEREQAKA